MKRINLFLLTLLVFFGACQKELPQVNKPEDYRIWNGSQLFEAYWNGMNTKYPFWDIDPTDWDEVYRKYQPLFAKLKPFEPESDLKARAYFQEITANLIDAHAGLYFNDPLLPIIPQEEKLKFRPDYHERTSLNYFKQVLPDTYLDPGAISATSGDEFSIAVTGRIEGDILYFHSNYTYLLDYYQSGDPVDDAINEATNYFFDALKGPNNIKGVILDVRSNGGGLLNDIPFVMGRMVNQTYEYCSRRAKSGPGRLDFGPWMPGTIVPQKDSRELKIPVIALTDMYTVSGGETIAMAVKALPNGNGLIIGEPTYGAMGPRIRVKNAFHSGEFNITNYMTVIISTAATRFKDGKIYEGIGLPPDIAVKTDLAALEAGKDAQLEKAIEIIRQQPQPGFIMAGK